MARVLVVDDDIGVLLLIERILVAAGHAVAILEKGGKTKSLIETFRPDVIVTDIFMPEVDGLEVIRLVREVDLGIPIIITSGHHLDGFSQPGTMHSPYYLAAAQSLGANGALPKPFSSAQLLAAIDAELGSGRDVARLPA